MADDPLNGWRPSHEAYFGDPWPSDVCEVGRRANTPVGALCHLCAAMVIFGHQGTWLTAFSEFHQRVVQVPAHRECLLRALVGSLTHLEQRCECFGGTDEAIGTYREQALASWAWLEARRFQLPDAGPAARVH